MTIDSSVNGVLNTLSGVRFDGSAASAMKYATELSSLNAAQQKIVLSTLGLNTEEQKQITMMLAAKSATEKLTVAELERTLNLSAGEIATRLHIRSTDEVTDAVLAAAIANGVLSEEQLQQLATTVAQTAANNAGATSFNTLGASMKSAAMSMMMTPMGWISALMMEKSRQKPLGG